jgi:hypothetical protein
LTDHTLVLFTRNGMGDAPPDLQQKLAGIFLNLLNMDAHPGAIAFYGEGVKLVCEETPALDLLRSLSEKGVTMIICQTCLDYFGLRGSVRVGVIGGMGDIVAAMARADKVITV